MAPRVSLSLPVFNGEAYLEPTIRSLLAQDFTDFELIITDNASTDRTEDICRDFARRDPQIRYVRNERNRGAAANFNLGFDLSSGEYFKWCAADDLLSANYLSECVRALDGNRRAAVAYGRVVEIDEAGTETSRVEAPIPGLQKGRAVERLRALLPEHTRDGAIFGLHRRATLQRTKLHQPYYSSDCALLSEIVVLGKVLYLPQATLFNREHPRRSINLDTEARVRWQNPESSAANAFELSRRIAHLYSVAFRHRDVAPLHLSWYYVTLWAIRPIHVGRVALEGVGAVSPAARRSLRAGGLRLLGLLESARGRRSA